MKSYRRFQLGPLPEADRAYILEMSAPRIIKLCRKPKLVRSKWHTGEHGNKENNNATEVHNDDAKVEEYNFV